MAGNNYRISAIMLVALLINSFSADCKPKNSAIDFKSNSNANSSKDHSFQKTDYVPTNGWKNTTPEEQGVDSEQLADMLQYVKDNHYSIDSITIVRNGYIITDAYLNSLYNNKDMKHNIYSCTKSITSTLMGIAIDGNYIKDVNQPVLGFFSDKKIKNLDDHKKAMTLKHLLTMSSGMRARDEWFNRYEGLFALIKSKDWVQHVLDLPVDEMPGKRYEYSNQVSFLIAAAIQKAVKMNILDFAKKNLFSPLGITDVRWDRSPDGINKGWGDMWLRPRDLAKIGLLFLNQGKWGERRIVSAEWIRKATSKHIDPTDYYTLRDQNGKALSCDSLKFWFLVNNSYPVKDGYGYQWWIDDSGMFAAVGAGGQFLYVIPAKNMVVVFTAGLPGKDFKLSRTLIDTYINPAAKSHKLPENAKGYRRLEALSREMSLSADKPGAFRKLPETASKISGKTLHHEGGILPATAYSQLTFKEGYPVAIMKGYIGGFYDTEYTLAVGLDNIYRFTKTKGDSIACKGGWTGDNVFEFMYQFVGNGWRGKVRYEFKEDRFKHLLEDTMLGKETVNGRVTDTK